MTRTGGCNCGKIRYTLEGAANRVGLCHCETCCKETGSAFSYFGVWPKANADVRGDTHCWSSRSGGRHFCPTCGSSIFDAEDSSGEIEIRLGTLDEPPSDLRPEYELWIIRREHWLRVLPENEQHERDRK